MPIIPFETYIENLWFVPVVMIVALIIRIYLLKIEKKIKTERKEKDIYQHIKMVDEQREKYRKDKEQKKKFIKK